MKPEDLYIVMLDTGELEYFNDVANLEISDGTLTVWGFHPLSTGQYKVAIFSPGSWLYVREIVAVNADAANDNEEVAEEEAEEAA